MPLSEFSHMNLQFITVMCVGLDLVAGSHSVTLQAHLTKPSPNLSPLIWLLTDL